MRRIDLYRAYNDDCTKNVETQGTTYFYTDHIDLYEAYKGPIYYNFSRVMD